jgi:coenzyme F420-0:L-glutamate ligase/coenzyme F420-1:gamma-L-glutamate ligase
MNIIPLNSERVERDPDIPIQEWISGQLEKNSQKLQNGDILVISSKILSYFEGKVVSLAEIQASEEAKEIADEINQEEKLVQLILEEADEVVARRPWVLLTKKNGIYTANAGVDTSNVEHGYAVLWPEDPFSSALEIKKSLKEKYKLTKIAVLIVDSAILPSRKGTVAMCIGHAEIQGLEDLAGEDDLFGNTLRYSSLNIVDSLATSANLMMGESKEACPMAIIRNYEWKTPSEKKNDEMLISSSDDMFLIG